MGFGLTRLDLNLMLTFFCNFVDQGCNRASIIVLVLFAIGSATAGYKLVQAEDVIFSAHCKGYQAGTAAQQHCGVQRSICDVAQEPGNEPRKGADGNISPLSPSPYGPFSCKAAERN